MSFGNLNIIDPLLRAIALEGYTTPTPIQMLAIPPLLEGKDLLGIAQTGTGKTAAFVLPILQRMSAERRASRPGSPRVLVLAPTRELAAQIGQSFATYGKFLRFRQLVIFGGVRQGPQVNMLSRGVDILVATPGRLLDLMNQGYIELKGVEFFVLDEIDRMLDMGFIRDVKRIVSALPEKHSSLFFSATLTRETGELAQSLLNDPVHVQASPSACTLDSIDQQVFFVDQNSKNSLLLDLLLKEDMKRVLVFARTKHRADKVAQMLSKNRIQSDAIHGNKSQNQRTKTMERFRSGRIRVLMASLDVNRPAAQEQLATLGTQAQVATLPIVEGQRPVEIAKRALQAAKLQGYDVVMLDTAGRLHVDQALMDEMQEVAGIASPHEILLVVDALTGQDAVNVAKSFSEQVPLTGVVLTRMDGDARGGAALSMRAVTQKPIKFVGTGEKLDGIEAFHPSRVAGRILGMGDVVSLVERAAETIRVDEAEKLAAKMAKGQFDMNDLRAQLNQMRRMGGLGALAGMLPGVKQVKNAMASGAMDDRVLVRLDAIIGSMTNKERTKPELMNAKRKIRVAKGSGTTVQDVNKLLKMHQEMSTAMKKIRKMGGLKGLAAMFGAGKGLPAASDAGGAMPQLPPGGLPGLPGMPGPGGIGGGAPFNLPPGFNKFLKK